MRIIIVGCSRVGAYVASELDKHGERVTVIDVSARSFQRLPADFGGETVRGNGVDEDVLRSAGAEQADIVLALTEGDNRNALAAQLAKHTFSVPRVIAKINDPLRAEAYRALGLETICRTLILGGALVTATVEGAAATNGFVREPTAQPLRTAPPAAATPDAGAAGAPTAAVVQPRDGIEGGI